MTLFPVTYNKRRSLSRQETTGLSSTLNLRLPMSAYDNAYYARRSPEKKTRKVELQAARKRAIAAAVRAYKAERGCMDCPERDPIVLEFDHRDPAAKSFNVGDVTQHGYALSRVMAEIDKCDVVCANCHRRRTAKQQSWV
jgi:hypothetical protein